MKTNINAALDQLATEVYNYTMCRVDGHRMAEDKHVLAGMVRGIAAATGVTAEAICDCTEYDTDVLYFTASGEPVSGSEFETHRSRLLRHVLRLAA